MTDSLLTGSLDSSSSQALTIMTLCRLNVQCQPAVNKAVHVCKHDNPLIKLIESSSLIKKGGFIFSFPSQNAVEDQATNDRTQILFITIKLQKSLKI